jgi:hypothetical protein
MGEVMHDVILVLSFVGGYIGAALIIGYILDKLLD